MTKISGEAFAYTQEQKYKADTARTDDIHAGVLGKIQQLNYDPTIDPTDSQPKGLLLKRGKSAIGLADRGQKQVSDILSSATEGVTDTQQLALIHHRLSSIPASESLSYLREEANQTEAYGISTKKGLIDTLETQLPTLAFQPERFDEVFKSKQAKVLELAESTGMDPTVAVREAADKSIKETVQYIAKLGDPEGAHAFMKNNTDRLTPGTVALLENELLPATRARIVDSLVQDAVKAGKDPNYPDAPMDEEKAIAYADSKLKTPEEKALAREKIGQIRSDHDKTLKDRADYYGGVLVDKWEKNPSLTVLDIMKEPEYGKLNAAQQGKIEATIRKSIEHRNAEERTVLAAEKHATAAASAAVTAAKKERREASVDGKYRLLADPAALLNMTEDARKIAIANLRPEEQVEVKKEIERLTVPKHLADAHVHRGIVLDTLDGVPGLEGDAGVKLTGRILSKLGRMQKDKGTILSDDEVRDEAIKEARLQFVEEKTWYGATKVLKRGIAVTKDDKVLPRAPEVQSRIDAITKKRGRPLTAREEMLAEQYILSAGVKK
jgi:hypothetical protein